MINKILIISVLTLTGSVYATEDQQKTSPEGPNLGQPATAEEVAAAMQAKWKMGLAGGMLIGVPVPDEYALPSEEIDTVIADAIAEMQQQGISGKDTTPYLLGSIVERTGGKSLDTNIQLVLNNARIAAAIATQFALKLL